MIDFLTVNHDESPKMAQGRTAPSMASACGTYMIRPVMRSGQIGFILDAPGVRETFLGGATELLLADAMIRANVLASIDSAIDLRGLS
jgi:hypothetical protein